MNRINNVITKIRTWYYSKTKGLVIGKNSVILGKIDIDSGRNTIIGDDCVISSWVVFKEWGGTITVGNNCSINSFCHLSGNGGIEIGNNVRIATQCVIVSANHNFSQVDIPIVKQGETKQKIVIGDDCWLGAGVKVLAGVHIGKGCVVGAGAVVVNDLEPYSVAVGVPARVIKKRS